ncbi:MAG: hypothetical protein IPL86_19160 [Flavobacteriales bacterium]|nr:hypothetical protein [Flavobacteriales bacterium]
MIPQNIKWGWRHDVENTDRLMNGCSPENHVRAMRGNYDGDDHQKLADILRADLRVQNQGSQGSCRGNSGSSALEASLIISGGDTALQLSAQFFYIECQKIDGIRGDHGATVEGGIQLMEDVGCPPEELWLYPNPVKYETSPPQHSLAECKEAATRYRTRKHYDCRSYETARTFLESNQGPIDSGILWTESMAGPGETIESYSGGIIGAHATLLACLSTRKDKDGRPYIDLLNSWGKEFGRKGWKSVSPTAWNQFSRNPQNILIGVSDMENPTPRPWDFVKRPVTH